MFVARRGCPKEERRGCSSSAVCSGPRGCAGSVFCVLTRRRARPVPRQSNLCPAQGNLKVAETEPDHRGGEMLPLLLWCSHVACYAVRSARFHRMAPRSEPLETPDQRLGSKRDTGIRSRSKLPERERSSSLASGLILAARAALEGDLAKGKGSLEAKGLP